MNPQPVARLGAASQASPGIAAHRECGQHTAPIPRPSAGLLDLPDGAVMLERHIKLFVAGEPILIATSYLPVELADDPTDNSTAWHDVAIDELAVTNHTIVPAKYMDSWDRLPTTSERATLSIPKGANILVSVLSQPYQVKIDDRTMPGRADPPGARRSGPPVLGPGIPGSGAQPDDRRGSRKLTTRPPCASWIFTRPPLVDLWWYWRGVISTIRRLMVEREDPGDVGSLRYRPVSSATCAPTSGSRRHPAPGATPAAAHDRSRPGHHPEVARVDVAGSGGSGLPSRW